MGLTASASKMIGGRALDRAADEMIAGKDKAEHPFKGF